jgi:ABC-type polysaccharide/polyol phosphate export permease
MPSQAVQDLWESLAQYEVWWRFAIHEIRQRFRRSVLGPLWITLSMGIWVSALGLVFTTLFNQPIDALLPYIATGIIFWGFFTTSLTDGSTVFIGNDSYIRNVPLPLLFHLFRMLARNLIILGLNMVIFVIIGMIFGFHFNWASLSFFPAFVLFTFNVSWMALACGILSTRYRDIPPVIQNVLQVVFFVTPIFWSIDNLPNRPAFVQLNPVFDLLQIVRAPLLGGDFPLRSWIVCLAMAAVGGVLTLILYRRAYARIAYWV